MRHPREVALPFTVDRSRSAPLGEQLVRQVRAMVASGVLRAGDPLPSSRTLASRLGISRGTVTAAWDVLAGEGYLQTDRGATRIAPDVLVPVPSTPTTAPRASGSSSLTRAGAAPAAPGSRGAAVPGRTRSVTRGLTRTPSASEATEPTARPAASAIGQDVIDLRPGAAAITALDTPAWRGAWRDAASEVVGGGPGAPGTRRLRAHLAQYLRRNRGVLREPEEIVVTAGARDGLQLVLRALGATAGRPLRVAVEDPGYPALRRVVEAAGHVPLPVRVDEHGLDPADLPTGRWSGLSMWDVAETPDLVLVTPGHQYPLGGTMPVSRRLELLRWAGEHRAVVVEDDYDSELRHTGQPLPALAALDTHRDTVITLGSFTKVLGGGVGVGHLVAPDRLLPRISTLREALGSPVSEVAQTALARFMDSGHLHRHTARMRRAYRDRRALLAHRLDGIPGVHVVPMAGGSHAVVGVPDESATVRALADRGVLVSGLGGYWAASSTGRTAEQGGLVLGLAAEKHRFTRGVSVLHQVLAGD